MTGKQALARLRKFGSAQTRKTYGRHGVHGEMYGVKFGDLATLVKEIRQDHELALELWDSGNHDARVLATMIADPDRLTAKVLGVWIKEVNNHVTSYQVAARIGQVEVDHGLTACKTPLAGPYIRKGAAHHRAKLAKAAKAAKKKTSA